MARKRFMFQILPAFMAVVFLSLVPLAYVVSRTIESVETEQGKEDLLARATLFRAVVDTQPLTPDNTELQALCQRLGAASRTRLTIIAPDGTVLADSSDAPETMDNHASRPEVAEAMKGMAGAATRFSYTVNEKMVYIALPAGNPPGACIIRASFPLTSIDATIKTIYRRLGATVLIVTLCATLISWLLSRRLVRPIIELKAGAARFACGDFARQLAVPDSEEFGSLAEALNEMARQCAFRIQAMEQQRNEQDAVFASMMEGVFAVDSELRIISMNEAASALLRVDANAVKGRPMLEAVRNTALRDFVQGALASTTPVEAELSVGQRDPLLLKVQGAKLHDGNGRIMGAVVVLNDVTRLRRLEEVRQDFVANVSHELKTPITSIKGFVETLLDDPEPTPENTRRFLQIVEKQANRLDAIIEDLLSLSRLEQTKGPASLKLEHAPLRPIINAAVELCQHQADLRAIHIRVDCPQELKASVNPPLLEQGLVNLINNAVKYSEDGQAVLVRAGLREEGLVIDVVDEGTGIHANELDRIFERFYRIDKARSRDLGGTGLGLSIVKHIAQAHSGRVSVVSVPGEGSTFSLHFPLG